MNRLELLEFRVTHFAVVHFRRICPHTGGGVPTCYIFSSTDFGDHPRIDKVANLPQSRQLLGPQVEPLRYPKDSVDPEKHFPVQLG